jgi:hypothetical protein
MAEVQYNLSQQIPEFDGIICGNETTMPTFLKVNQCVCATLFDQIFNVIRYDKKTLTPDLNSTYGLCRSIIVNSHKKVVSFAPPKSISYDVFSKMYPAEAPHLVAQEFVEGTMINVFWDETSGYWEFATRSTVGASSKFYKKMTFRDMFLDAANANNLCLDTLDKSHCYSFVLQHPENRIVVPFSNPQLYLVAVYSIDNTPDNIKVTSHDIYEIKSMGLFDTTTVKLPERYEFTSYNELVDKFGSMNTPYDCLGVVIYNKETGERTKIRNPVYEQVRHLKGNQPKMHYQYLCLRKEGKVGDFLKYYPENKYEFANYRNQLHSFTYALYQNYISCYIKKERPLLEFSQQFRTHMFNIHQIYITQLKEQKLHVNNAIVINYVNGVHPSLLMFCLNFHMRKKNTDRTWDQNTQWVDQNTMALEACEHGTTNNLDTND